MKLPLDTALGDAKERLREAAKKPGPPARCPCCDRRVKLYERPIYASMARALITLYRWNLQHPSEFLHLGPHITQTQGWESGDHAKLRYWDLIEPDVFTRDDGSTRNGYWRITGKGAAFVRNEITVPSHALVYNSELIRLTEKKGQVSIIDSLGKNFHYAELMANKA